MIHPGNYAGPHNFSGTRSGAGRQEHSPEKPGSPIFKNRSRPHELLAHHPAIYPGLLAKATRFVADESLSREWGIALRPGLDVPDGLREYGLAARSQVIDRPVAEATAERFGVTLSGGRGVIGALAAVALAGPPHEVLLEPAREIGPGA